MDKASISNLVFMSVLTYFIAENSGSHRIICNLSHLLNKFQIILPQIWDYPKRVIYPLIESYCSTWTLNNMVRVRSLRYVATGHTINSWIESPTIFRILRFRPDSIIKCNIISLAHNTFRLRARDDRKCVIIV